MRRLLLLLGVFGALASAQSYRVVDARGKVVEVRSVEREGLLGRGRAEDLGAYR